MGWNAEGWGEWGVMGWGAVGWGALGIMSMIFKRLVIVYYPYACLGRTPSAIHDTQKLLCCQNLEVVCLYLH